MFETSLKRQSQPATWSSSAAYLPPLTVSLSFSQFLVHRLFSSHPGIIRPMALTVAARSKTKNIGSLRLQRLPGQIMYSSEGNTSTSGIPMNQLGCRQQYIVYF